MEAVPSAAEDGRLLNCVEPVERGSLLPRACSEMGVKLFGVRITDGTMGAMMRKAVSMGSLSSYNCASSLRAGNARSSNSEQSDSGEAPGAADPQGYVSDGLVLTSAALREKKKGVPWTEEEHRMFLMGLQKLGKGDWRGIARAFVLTRTPTQVASHAQKYFLRQNNLGKRKRRSSLFDMISSNLGSSACNPADHSGSLTDMSLLSSAHVSADLCLGRADEVQSKQQLLQVPKRCHQFSSQPQANAVFGTRVPPERLKLLGFPAMLSSQSTFVDSNAKRARLTGMPISLPSSSAITSSASSSSLSSLCRIDEDPELAADLTLSIGRPYLSAPSGELTLKLEQPSLQGSTNNSDTSYENAIRVV